MEPKKRSLGAGERDEFLRATWRLLVAGEVDAERMVFVDLLGAPTFRFRRSTPGGARESELSVAPQETGPRT